jgi:PleD family two-component response regulator
MVSAREVAPGGLHAALIFFRFLPITHSRDAIVKILLVEDSRSIRLENERVLGHAGHQVISAEDGEQALRYARETQPDLVLHDLLLPKIPGRKSWPA